MNVPPELYRAVKARARRILQTLRKERRASIDAREVAENVVSTHGSAGLLPNPQRKQIIDETERFLRDRLFVLRRGRGRLRKR